MRPAAVPASEPADNSEAEKRTSGLAGFFPTFPRRQQSLDAAASSGASDARTAKVVKGDQQNASLFSMLFWPPEGVCTPRGPEEAGSTSQSSKQVEQGGNSWVGLAAPLAGATVNAVDDDVASQPGSDACSDD